MNDAVALAESLPRPKGVTKRQMRLAALLPRCETAAEALRQAGYALKTIDRNPTITVGSIGVKRAEMLIQQSRMDRARGFIGASQLALQSVKEDIDALEPRDRLAAAVKFAETAHQLGENIEQRGDGATWKQRIRRACRLMARLTESRLRHNGTLNNS